MLSKTGFTHSDLLRWQIDYAGGSLNVNGTIMRDTYNHLFHRNNDGQVFTNRRHFAANILT
ncbi:hypothetical protein DLB58_23885 [Salmonella enterica subsp. enterica serovar Hull]|nr:hypothetical protein [Salmonella enterica]EBE9789311.1 hypothetical protein [Salmonella enterica]EBU8383574.1 hypothetical protein [Salmonella enterica subsp. enterica serovar Hull]